MLDCCALPRLAGLGELFTWARAAGERSCRLARRPGARRSRRRRRRGTRPARPRAARTRSRRCADPASRSRRRTRRPSRRTVPRERRLVPDCGTSSEQTLIRPRRWPRRRSSSSVSSASGRGTSTRFAHSRLQLDQDLVDVGSSAELGQERAQLIAAIGPVSPGSAARRCHTSQKRPRSTPTESAIWS